ncbi:COP9 signalosome complex subunit 7a isoform X1 [Zonotrichia albicollis]
MARTKEGEEEEEEEEEEGLLRLSLGCPPPPPAAARPARPGPARLGSARLRSPGSSVISGSSQEAIRLPWREVSPRDPSLQLAPANATPGPVRPWGRRPPGIPLPRAAPRGSSPPPLAFPPRSNARGDMPPLGPAPRPPSPHPSSPGSGPRGRRGAGRGAADGLTDGRPRRGAPPAGQTAGLSRASRAETLGHMGELADSEFSPVFRLLTIFAYGTYADYLAEAANLPPLTEAQKNKLRHLSVVTLAAKIKCIPYSVLLEQLQLKNVRQLEDLVIEAVYADVLRGSLDQRNQRLEVDYSIGRDIRREELSTITRTLQEWCQGCEVVLSGIEEQVSRANQHKEQQLALKQQIESEVANLKKTIKVTTAAAAAATSQDPEQHLTELREPAPGTNQRQASKKTSKAKGLRGSTKIWSKSN